MDSLDGIVFALPDDDEDNLLDIRALLQPEWIPEYERQRGLLYDEMVALEMRLFIYEKLHNVPFNFFLMPDEYVFWKVVKTTLVEYLIISAFRLFVDTRDDVLTINSFKKAVSDHLRDQACSLLFDEQMRRTNFDPKFGELRKQINILRHNRFAHLSLGKKYNKKYDDLSLTDLREIVNSAEHLFNLLCSPVYSSFVLMEYMTEERENTPLDKLINVVINHAPITHAPEDDEGWSYIRENYSEADIQLLNHLRRRLKMPSVE